MTQTPAELEAIFDEIWKANNAGLHYTALAVALSVPDICSCLEQEPGKIWAKTEKYIAWCDAHLVSRFKHLTGKDISDLRGGILHQGNFRHPKSAFDGVMFVGPNSAIRFQNDIIITVAPGVQIGGKTMEEIGLGYRILVMEVVPFCTTIADAAREWVVAKASDPFVQSNLPRLVRFRPNGLPPFAVGVPVIA